MNNNTIYRIIFILCLIASIPEVNAQEDNTDGGSSSTKKGKDINLIISGTLYDDGMKMEGVSVSISGENIDERSIYSDDAGRFKVECTLDEILMVRFIKDGYVEKMVEVDTRNVPEANRKYDFFYKGWKVDMFPTDLDVDFSSLKKPVAKVVYNPAEDGFSTDKKYERSVRPSRERLVNAVYEAYNQRDEEIEGAFDDYMLAVKDGDLFLKEGDYENALIQYEAAKDILPNEAYPDKQIKKTMALMQANQSEDEQYAQFIASADDAFDNKEWDKARTAYEDAQGVKPKMDYPKDQIDKIVKNIADEKLAAKQMAEKEKLDMYNAFVAAGDSLLAAKSYSDSKEKYNEALEVIVKEYPKSKIKEIDAILAQNRKAEDAYKDLLANANKFMNDKKYDQAKETYTDALGLKPDAEQPKEKLKEIESILAGLAAMEALEAKLAAKKEADLKAQYDALIVSADALMVDQSYEKAKAEYEKALVLKQDEVYPKDQITLINSKLVELEGIDKQYTKLLADAQKNASTSKYELAKSNYQAALDLKPTESAPKDGIAAMDAKLAGIAADEVAKQKALDDKYDEFVAEGDAMMTLEKYMEAKVAYEEALKVKTKEAYPISQIAVIEDKLKALALAAAASEKEAKELAAKEETYNQSIKKADQLFESGDYNGAKLEYQEALNIFAGKTYPTSQIAEIDTKLAEMEALAAKKELELKAQYDALIVSADALMEGKSYDKAKAEYEKALALRKDEVYPKDQITLINSKLVELEGIDKQYTKLMADAQKNASTNKFELARSNYQAASGLKPSESAPKDGIAAMDAKLASIAAEELAKQKAIDDKYDGFIAEGDAMMTLEKYAEAKDAYKQALAVKNKEAYPTSQLVVIDDKLKAIAIAAAAADKEAKELAAKELAYNQSIGKADQLYKSGDYNGARLEYQNALEIFAGKAYPVSQMAEIDSKLAAIKAEEEAKAKELAATKAKEEEYASKIAKADAAFESKDFVNARLEYQNAQQVFVDRPYPKSQIRKIEELELAAKAKAEQEALELAKMEENKKRFDELVNEGDAFVNSNELQKGKYKYEAALKLFPGDVVVTTKMREVTAKMEEARKLAEFHAKNDTEFNKQLAIDYPNGLNETTKGGGKTTTRIVIVANNRGDEYKKEVYSYGAVFYFKNGKKIDEGTFKRETKGH